MLNSQISGNHTSTTMNININRSLISGGTSANTDTLTNAATLPELPSFEAVGIGGTEHDIRHTFLHFARAAGATENEEDPSLSTVPIGLPQTHTHHDKLSKTGARFLELAESGNDVAQSLTPEMLEQAQKMAKMNSNMADLIELISNNPEISLADGNPDLQLADLETLAGENGREAISMGDVALLQEKLDPEQVAAIDTSFETPAAAPPPEEGTATKALTGALGQVDLHPVPELDKEGLDTKIESKRMDATLLEFARVNRAFFDDIADTEFYQTQEDKANGTADSLQTLSDNFDTIAGADGNEDTLTREDIRTVAAQDGIADNMSDAELAGETITPDGTETENGINANTTLNANSSLVGNGETTESSNTEATLPENTPSGDTQLEKPDSEPTVDKSVNEPEQSAQALSTSGTPAPENSVIAASEPVTHDPPTETTQEQPANEPTPAAA